MIKEIIEIVIRTPNDSELGEILKEFYKENQGNIVLSARRITQGLYSLDTQSRNLYRDFRRLVLTNPNYQTLGEKTRRLFT
jgi:hypothetical protein